MCIRTYSHKEIYIYMHIYVYIRHPLWRRPPDRSISNDPLMENIHPLNLRWKLKKMVWIWPKLLGPWNLLNSHDSEYTMRILTWIYCCWIHILLTMLILRWKLKRCVVLFKWFGAISLSVVECFGRCGWAWDLGDHSPLVTLFNYKMMKLPSGWKKQPSSPRIHFDRSDALILRLSYA